MMIFMCLLYNALTTLRTAAKTHHEEADTFILNLHFIVMAILLGDYVAQMVIGAIAILTYNKSVGGIFIAFGLLGEVF